MSQQITGWPQTPPSDANVVAALLARIKSLEDRYPVKVVRSDSSGLTSSVGSVTIHTSAGAGMFMVSVYAKVTTAGAGGDTLTVTIGWNDGTAQTNTPLNAVSLAGLNTYFEGRVAIYAANGAAITLATTVVKAGAPVYDLHIDVERLN